MLHFLHLIFICYHIVSAWEKRFLRELQLRRQRHDDLADKLHELGLERTAEFVEIMKP